MIGDSQITSLKNKANKAKAKGNLKEAIECYDFMNEFGIRLCHAPLPHEMIVE